MPKTSRRRGSPGEEALAGRRRKAPPFEFVLERLDRLSPTTRPMFGCLAVYVGEKIVLILRDSVSHTEDNGVWLATTREHHESLRRDFPGMRSISVLGTTGETGWQILPADAPDFEEAALKACALIHARDPRIGKVPKPKRRPAAKPRGRAQVSRTTRSPKPAKQPRR